MSSNDGKIYIIVTNKLPGGSSTPTPGVSEQPTNDDTKSRGTALGSWVQHQFYGLIKSQVIADVHFSINNIGNFTGDYQSQRDAQMGLTSVNKLINIGMSAYAGFKATGSPIGALFAVGIFAVTEAISAQRMWKVTQVEQKKTNYNIEQLRIRSGLNSLTDGSRGTQN